MIFNCTGCGISISTQRDKCPYCKTDNAKCIEMITGIKKVTEKMELKEKLKGTIFSFVHR